jgi:hypothetical protein
VGIGPDAYAAHVQLEPVVDRRAGRARAQRTLLESGAAIASLGCSAARCSGSARRRVPGPAESRGSRAESRARGARDLVPRTVLA